MQRGIFSSQSGLVKQLLSSVHFIPCHFHVLLPPSAVKEQLASEVKAWEEKHGELDLKFNRLQKRAKQRIQELTKVGCDAQMCNQSPHSVGPREVGRNHSRVGCSWFGLSL